MFRAALLATPEGSIKRSSRNARESSHAARGFASLAAVVLGLCVAPEPAVASGYELDRTAPGTLAIELGVALALATGTFMLPSPRQCRWCTPPAFDEALHSPVAPVSRIAVAGWSHAISFFLLPLGGFAALVLPPLSSSEPDRHGPENAVIFAEAFTLNAAVTVGVKKAFGRKRPAFYYRRAELTEFNKTKLEPFLSFFSGDTSSAFVCASTASTLAFMRGYSNAPYVTAAGAVLAASAGLMRIGADVHWPSDVFTGAVVGTAIGIVVPLVLHPRRRDREESGEGVPAMQPLFHFSGSF